MKITIIDNDRSLLRSLTILLSREGHEVTTFSDPVEAMHTLQSDGTCDVLLLDYMMPELNGISLLRAVGGRLPRSTKTVMMTGHLENVPVHELREAHVDELCSKPVDLPVLLQLIGQQQSRPENERLLERMRLRRTPQQAR